MIIVADSGSTKTSWRLIGSDRIIAAEETIGFNPLALNSTDAQMILKNSAITEWPVNEIQEICFYGAGIVGSAQEAEVQAVLKLLFLNAKVHANSDLLGAGRAGFGNDKGIIGILGTGSNSGFYDGIQISKSIPPLGYILGDEGSGSALGKALLTAFLRNQLSEELIQSFKEFYPEHKLLIEEIYQEKHAARKLAGFVPFILANKESPELKQLLNREFLKYLNLLQEYDLSQPIVLVGSIAHYFENELRSIAALQGLQIHRIIKSPIEELSLYHQSKINEPD